MSNHPTISLVTPSLNQARFLAPTLRSVHVQDYPHLEHVVIDGGSTDGSQEIIRAHSHRLAWWCSEPDHGMYDAINKGFAHTTGEIMGWLNSDDLLLPGALSTVAGIFACCPEVQWLSSTTLSTWNTTGVSVGTSEILGYSREAFLDGRYLPERNPAYGWIPQESTFWRRSLWAHIGGQIDPTLRLAGDFDLWARFYAHTELVGTQALIGGFRSHEKQMSRAIEKYRIEARPALARLRSQLHHRQKTIRAILLRSHLPSLPGLRRLLTQRFGYSGTRAIPNAAGRFSLEHYKFL